MLENAGFRLQEARAAGFDDAYIYEKSGYSIISSLVIYYGSIT